MEDIEYFNLFFSEFENLTAEELQQTFSICEFVEYRKNEIILAEGEIDRYVYFLKEGMVRQFYTNPENLKDYSVMFFWRTGIVSSYISYTREIPSPISLQALVPTQIYRAKKTDLENLYAKNHKIESLGRKVTEFLLLEMMERYMELLSLPKKERYELLENQWGKKRIKQISIKHISSFLGIEPESLSRIRRELKNSRR